MTKPITERREWLSPSKSSFAFIRWFTESVDNGELFIELQISDGRHSAELLLEGHNKASRKKAVSAINKLINELQGLKCVIARVDFSRARSLGKVGKRSDKQKAIDVRGYIYTEVDCPECGELVRFEGDVAEQNIDCPECGAVLWVCTVI